MKPAISNSTLDGIAVFLSATCLVHCLALPLMLTLPAIGLGSFLDHETFHLVMLVFVLPFLLGLFIINRLCCEAPGPRYNKYLAFAALQLILFAASVHLVSEL